jgi:hypothetical protein
MKSLTLTEMEQINGGTSWLGAFALGFACGGAIAFAAGTGGLATAVAIAGCVAAIDSL